MNRLTGFIIMILVGGLMMMGACKKDQNPKLPDLKRASVPLVKRDAGSDDSIRNVNTFQGKFSVGLYFQNDELPKKMDVVVAFNGDYTIVKILKADVTTYPTSITVTAQQLAALFGKDVSSLVSKNYFEIGVDVYMNSGLVVPIFSNRTVASPYGPDAASYTGASLKIKYVVK
ncbi:hypothetical protein [Chitinophaga niastensis]|nr:hypothetical protein [Chitinophaga niastensis]